MSRSILAAVTTALLAGVAFGRTPSFQGLGDFPAGYVLSHACAACAANGKPSEQARVSERRTRCRVQPRLASSVFRKDREATEHES